MGNYIVVDYLNNKRKRIGPVTANTLSFGSIADVVIRNRLQSQLLQIPSV